MTWLRVLLRRAKKKAMTAGANRVAQAVPNRHVRGVSGAVVAKGSGDDVAARLHESAAAASFFAAVDARRSLARGWDFDTGSTGAAFWGQAEGYGPGDAERLFDDAEDDLAQAEELFSQIDWTQDLTS